MVQGQSTVLLIRNFSLNLKNKSKKIVVVIFLATVVCFSNVESVSAIGLALPPTPVIRVQPSSQHDSKVQIAKVIPRKKDLIVYKSRKEILFSCVIKSENLRFLTSSSRIQDYILKSRGGFEELTSEEEKILIKSILSKAPESSYSEISINKFFFKILKFIEPVISDPRVWKILGEFGKPIKSKLPGP